MQRKMSFFWKNQSMSKLSSLMSANGGLFPFALDLNVSRWMLGGLRISSLGSNILGTSKYSSSETFSSFKLPWPKCKDCMEFFKNIESSDVIDRLENERNEEIEDIDFGVSSRNSLRFKDDEMSVLTVSEASSVADPHRLSSIASSSPSFASMSLLFDLDLFGLDFFCDRDFFSGSFKAV